MKKSSRSAIFGAVAACLTFGASAHAALIAYGVNFVGGGNGGGGSVTTAAGVSTITGYNNEVGASGTGVAVTSGTGTGFSPGSNLSLTYSANGTWNGGTPNDGSTGTLLNGYLDSGNTAATGVKMTITGVPANTSAVLTLYTNGDNSGGQTSDYTVNGTNKTVQEGTGGSTTLAADGAGSGTPGNYVQFNLSGVNTITVASNANAEFRSPINGFDLVVTTATPEPASLGIFGLATGGLLARRRRSI